MCDEVTRYRLTILAFDDRAQFGQAIVDLIGCGLETGQFCLAGLPKTLDAIATPSGLDERASSAFAALLATADTPFALDAEAGLVARGGFRAKILLEAPDQAFGAFDWMQEARRRELARHGTNGAIILIVNAASAEELSASANVMLRHGRHTLQTHVFTRRLVDRHTGR